MKVTLDGKPLVRPDGRQPVFAADGIAISGDGATLYWQALTGKTLYSIATDRLRQDVGEADRAAAVSALGAVLGEELDALAPFGATELRRLRRDKFLAIG